MNVAGKVVVITGVTTGIGKAAFTGFARAGASVVGGARRVGHVGPAQERQHRQSAAILLGGRSRSRYERPADVSSESHARWPRAEQL